MIDLCNKTIMVDVWQQMHDYVSTEANICILFSCRAAYMLLPGVRSAVLIQSRMKKAAAELEMDSWSRF